MNATFWITAAFLLAVLAAGCLASLLIELRMKTRRLQLENRDLRSELAEAEERAAYWYDRAKAPKYAAPVFETTAEFHRRKAFERHTQEALAALQADVDEWERP